MLRLRYKAKRSGHLRALLAVDQKQWYLQNMLATCSNSSASRSYNQYVTICDSEGVLILHAGCLYMIYSRDCVNGIMVEAFCACVEDSLHLLHVHDSCHSPMHTMFSFSVHHDHPVLGFLCRFFVVRDSSKAAASVGAFLLAGADPPAC